MPTPDRSSQQWMLPWRLPSSFLLEQRLKDRPHLVQDPNVETSWDKLHENNLEIPACLQ
jgi:hypothetical protein